MCVFPKGNNIFGYILTHNWVNPAVNPRKRISPILIEKPLKRSYVGFPPIILPLRREKKCLRFSPSECVNFRLVPRRVKIGVQGPVVLEHPWK